MGSVSVSSCRCCMFVSCVHPVAVLNAAFCMTCSLLMLVEDAIGDHTEEAYSRAGLITAGLDITRFCEQQRQPSSGSAWPPCPKMVNRAPMAVGGKVRHKLQSSLYPL